MTTPSKRIVLHLVTSSTDSIAQVKIIKALAEELRSAYDVRCCFVSASGPLCEELETIGVATYSLDARSLRRFNTAISFGRLLRELDPAILHDHYGGLSSRVIARLVGVPLIVLHLHSQVPGRKHARWPRGPLFSDSIIATSNAVAETFRGISHTVVYPAVDVGRGVRSKVASQLIGAISRLSQEKGISHLIEAMGILREMIPALRLEIIGDGPQREELMALVSRMNLTSHVQFLGWQKDIRSHLVRWDLCAVPSLEEGFGMAAAEAMAVGVPVVASRVGGIPEVITDGKTGWLVDPGDPKALAREIQSAMTDSDKRDEIAEAGQRFVLEHFSKEKMSQKICAIYDSLLSG